MAPPTPRALETVDFSSGQQPTPDLGPRQLLEDWLRYQRHEFLRKLRGLSPDQLVAWSVPPVELSILGLVRHMTQMEHVWLVAGLGGGEIALRYGDDDYAGGDVDTVESDLDWYFREVVAASAAIARINSLDAVGDGHGWTLRATLIKMIDEYAIHAGQAHMLRFAALGTMDR